MAGISVEDPAQTQPANLISLLVPATPPSSWLAPQRKSRTKGQMAPSGRGEL
ncbi:hypothetical protein WN944_025827 [Citrus x changshan-huyou]|uniref:Uncharacterized protein n=1 Tax=Citrus x changshan-huyou TaxID=2935761 RepID=A0AAP0LU09_9ROSI